jgi:hypothetical protein
MSLPTAFNFTPALPSRELRITFSIGNHTQKFALTRDQAEIMLATISAYLCKEAPFPTLGFRVTSETHL